MAGLARGSLVEIIGAPKDAALGQDLNGERAQLLRFDRTAKKWEVVTFGGVTAQLEPQYLLALNGEDLRDYDAVLGPRTDLATLAPALAETLGEKGYAVLKLFVKAEDSEGMLKAADSLVGEDRFSRLAVEFERGYLGVDGYAKTLLLDLGKAEEVPQEVLKSPLPTVEANFAALTELLEPLTLERLGFKVYSRSKLMLQMPIEEGEDEKYESPDIEDGDAAAYMGLMVRKKLTMMQFVGPCEGSLTLLPKSSAGPSVQLKAEPGTMLLLSDARYDYSLQLKSKALTVSSMLLTEPPIFTLVSKPEGDMEVLGVLGSGPPPPPVKQCGIEGMFCKYGTGAEGRDQFWTGVGRASTDGLVEIPFKRFDYTYYYHPEGLGGATYTKHGSFGIEGVELFDNRFFEISPAEAKGMDPCQRQVLEVSYMALVEGGWDKRSLQKKSENIGHFVGIDKDDWMCMSAGGLLDLSGAHGAAAAANAITSNRFSYLLNLKGASMTIDTACSSSLVCTHVGKLHLRFKDAEEMPAAIVNGINIMLYQGPFCGCSSAGMLSHIGRSFTFNATADGYARGELSGAICAKLSNYKESSDSVLACLAGSQANQDGRSASMTAPNGPAQEKCVRSVLKECGLGPGEVDIFECHGTGTSLGDPIEVGAFKSVMGLDRNRPILVTSSKSNIAHAEGGAGLAGFFKCCLQVMHCEGASNVHLKVLNPHLDVVGFPIQMLSESTTLEEDGAYSGVSSFGFGGTNAHGEAWGRNIMTSRGGRLQDIEAAFKRKMRHAPAAEITMNGDDVFEWETTGPDPRAEIGSRWRVEVDEDGTATWEAEDDDMKDYGDEFFLQGSHNSWAPSAMERHDTISGLWYQTITIGSSGEESFQVVADSKPDMVYHPEVPHCAVKVPEIKGPDAASKDLCWVLKGVEGETFRIEFFQQEAHVALWWLRENEEE